MRPFVVEGSGIGRHSTGVRVPVPPQWRGRGRSGRIAANEGDCAQGGIDNLERGGKVSRRRRLGDRQLHRPDAADVALPVSDFRGGAGRIPRLGGTGEGGGGAGVRRVAGRRRPADRRGGRERADRAARRPAHHRPGAVVLLRLERDRSAEGRAQPRLRTGRKAALVAAPPPVARARAGRLAGAAGARLSGGARTLDPRRARGMGARDRGGAQPADPRPARRSRASCSRCRCSSPIESCPPIDRGSSISCRA